MVLDGEISADDYKEMKHEIESNLERLESDQTKIRNSLENYSVMVDDGLGVMKEIQKSYRTYDTVAKQRIISAFYPEKLIFENSGYRTPKTLRVLELMSRTGEGFKRNKKGKKTEISVSSLEVESEGFELII